MRVVALLWLGVVASWNGVSAQVGHEPGQSPYRDVRRGAVGVVTFGYLGGSRGSVGVGLSNVVPILISAAGRTRSPGSSIAFVVSFGYAGYLASPPVLGFIASASSLATMFLVVAASCAAIPAGWLLVERTPPDT